MNPSQPRTPNSAQGSPFLRLARIGSILLAYLPLFAIPAAPFQVTVLDADSGNRLPCRVHLRSDSGTWIFPQSIDPAGSALPYREQWVPMPGSEDQHSTVSAHPFGANLEPGTRYALEIEHGKEYLPHRDSFVMSGEPIRRTVRLQRFSKASALGWFSGETHVHRRIVELTNVMQAEDLNVAFPVTFWTTRSDRAPNLAPSNLRSQGPSPFGPREDRGTHPLWIDSHHVIVPRNTEYEIFSLGPRRHTLGALFLLNHQSVPDLLAPPIRPIAERAHAEGALLDLDKHNWPWSLMLVPVAKVDLFELSNNSVWRTRFGFNQAPEPLPEWMPVERDSPNTLTEWGWLQYGFNVYYALLNSGFPIAPTAGTASGVHPVPLGHSRVYVQTGDALDLDAWLAGLKAGRSFVTTGPMLFARLNQQWPGHRFSHDKADPWKGEITIEAIGARPISTVEIIVNGRVAHRFEPTPERTAAGAWSTKQRQSVALSSSAWVAVRCIETQPDGRKRFAHTGSWWITLGNQPVRPRREEVQWLVRRMQSEIERQRPILAPEALAEFEQARDAYEALLPQSQ